MEEHREDSISFTFSGRMADLGQLNFYESGRFLYGAARFVYTVEKFRQEGIVASRLTSRVNADIRLMSSRRGSFVQDILYFAAPIVAQSAVAVPFDVLFLYVWGLFLPRSRGIDVAVELARQEVDKQKEITTQEKERTKQLEAMAEVAKSGNATIQQALDILNHAVPRQLSVGTNNMIATRDEIQSQRELLESDLKRENKVKPFRDQLSKIDPEKERSLVQQLKNPITEIALPLRSSADRLVIGTPANANQYAFLDTSIVSQISSSNTDQNSTMFLGRIKMYDRETGYGRFRLENNNKVFSFRVPSAYRAELRDDILENMKSDSIELPFFIVRDSFGNPSSLILDENAQIFL